MSSNTHTWFTHTHFHTHTHTHSLSHTYTDSHTYSHIHRNTDTHSYTYPYIKTNFQAFQKSKTENNSTWYNLCDILTEILAKQGKERGRKEGEKQKEPCIQVLNVIPFREEAMFFTFRIQLSTSIVKENKGKRLASWKPKHVGVERSISETRRLL